jgi:hypothetical protein
MKKLKESQYWLCSQLSQSLSATLFSFKIFLFKVIINEETADNCHVAM